MALQKSGHNIVVTIPGGGPMLYCRSVGLPGIEGGDPIDVTSMVTTKYQAFAPSDLGKIPDVTLTAMFDPSDYAKAVAVLNKEQTISFALTSTATTALNGVGNRTTTQTISLYGWLRDYTPQECKTGEVPEVQVTFSFSGGTATGVTEGGNSNTGITVA